MNIIICGAGTVGAYAADVLAAAGHNITVIDLQSQRLSDLEDRMDIRTLAGNCTHADVLIKAGCKKCDLFVAATESDEINLLSAAVGKGAGAAKCVARVRHSVYFDDRGIDYSKALGIDDFICPEYSTALAIASSLRNPGALAIENFARGQIEMQELVVRPDAPTIGKMLMDLHMPGGALLAAIRRADGAMIPTARTEIRADDSVILVGNREVFQEARGMFRKSDTKLRRVVIMGGSPMAVWLCRAIRDRNFSIRLFETDRARAEELADKLGWVTVVNADPTDTSIFEEEHIEEADAFVSLKMDDDEYNILAGAWAKSMGAKMAIAAVQRPNYLTLMQRVGIDRPFSPRVVAVKEIENLIADRRLHQLASLAEGAIDVFQVAVSAGAPVVGKALRDVKLRPDWIIAAIQHGDDVSVPKADDRIQAGDTVLVIGKHGQEATLKKLLRTS